MGRTDEEIQIFRRTNEPVDVQSDTTNHRVVDSLALQAANHLETAAEEVFFHGCAKRSTQRSLALCAGGER